jgi:hypothetical protein
MPSNRRFPNGAERRPAIRRADLPELLDSLPKLGRDDADAFARDMDAAREDRIPVEDPWES